MCVLKKASLTTLFRRARTRECLHSQRPSRSRNKGLIFYPLLAFAAAVFLVAPRAAHADITSGLVGWYQLNGCLGGTSSTFTVADQDGNGSGSVVYAGSQVVNNTNTFADSKVSYKIWAYEEAPNNSARVYSADGVPFASVGDDIDRSFTVNLNWDGVSSADGYVIQSDVQQYVTTAVGDQDGNGTISAVTGDNYFYSGYTGMTYKVWAYKVAPDGTRVYSDDGVQFADDSNDYHAFGGQSFESSLSWDPVSGADGYVIEADIYESYSSQDLSVSSWQDVGNVTSYTDNGLANHSTFTSSSAFTSSQVSPYTAASPSHGYHWQDVGNVTSLTDANMTNGGAFTPGVTSPYTYSSRSSGSNVPDSSGNGNNGTATVKNLQYIESSAGNISCALNFNSTAGIDLPAMDLGGGSPRTISAWVYPT